MTTQWTFDPPSTKNGQTMDFGAILKTNDQKKHLGLALANNARKMDLGRVFTKKDQRAVSVHILTNYDTKKLDLVPNCIKSQNIWVWDQFGPKNAFGTHCDQK